jgi:hypothetical protein
MAPHILLEARLSELKINALLLKLAGEISGLLLESGDAVVFGQLQLGEEQARGAQGRTRLG